MGEKTKDRRTLRTKKALREALADLLAEKELHKVTVQEIADKADVNRVTFYKHYLDVYDLYDKIEEELLVGIGMLVLGLEELPAEKVFAHLIDYVDENRAVFRMLFSPNCTGKIREKFGKCLEGLFRQLGAEKKDSDLNDVILCYRTSYRAEGCIAVISRWVTNGFSESKEFIVNILAELDSSTEKLILSSKLPEKPKKK